MSRTTIHDESCNGVALWCVPLYGDVSAQPITRFRWKTFWWQFEEIRTVLRLPTLACVGSFISSLLDCCNVFYFNEIEMSLPFFFHTDLAQYCITDVPGLNLDTCFQDTHLETGANEIRERIAAWERMDVQLAADEISSCYQSHDYQHRVNSYPQATLALFSPLLRRL